MTKIKKLAQAATVAALTAPSIAFAQWSQGESNASSSGLPGGTIYDIIQTTMNWLLAILGFISIIGFVIAGILYLTAAGNADQSDKAKKAMLYSILGIVVALIGFVVVRAVTTWLGASSTTF